MDLFTLIADAAFKASPEAYAAATSRKANFGTHKKAKPDVLITKAEEKRQRKQLRNLRNAKQ
jgi:hypothetical protein